MRNISLSVIIPESTEGELTFEWAQQQLVGIDHEIIISDHWALGLQKARGEYLCFLEKDCVLGPRYFTSLLEQFVEKPSFRKLAMVIPSLGVNSYENRIYGYKLAPEDIYPSYIPASSSPYLVQIGYIPGAILRYSAIGDFVPREDDIVLDSASLSLNLWGSGQRILIVPTTFYISTEDKVDDNLLVDRNLEFIRRTGVAQIFKREAI